MMRSRGLLLALAALTGLALVTPASAQTPPSTVADRPAATLLLPYFEVDLANPAGANTFFSVNNASAAAALAHVTVWSAMHVPVYTFDVYLTGYDAQPMNVRDILSGKLPQTASAGQDPTQTFSPQGGKSQDINFFTCNGILPSGPVPQPTIDHVRAALTGQPSALAGGMCATKSDGTSIARGYITVDTVNQCTSQTPADTGYFAAGGTGIATNQNILWGDYVYTNHIGGLESGDGSPLVHIYADATDPETSTPGEYTFYGRVVGWTAVDNREPLSTTFGARFANVGTVGLTTLTVWRDSKVNQTYFACAGKPSWFPLGQEQIVFFDEQEEPEVTASSPFAPQPPSGTYLPFPSGAQRVRVGGSDFPTSFNFGWIYLNLNTTVAGSPNPPENPTAAQAYVSVHQKGTGRYSAGWPAVMFDTAKDRQMSFIPVGF